MKQIYGKIYFCMIHQWIPISNNRGISTLINHQHAYHKYPMDYWQSYEGIYSLTLSALKNYMDIMNYELCNSLLC